MTQFRTLVRVDREPAVCLSSVAEHLGASMPTTSRIVGGLVDKGFLTRRSCSDDRRSIALAITPRGRAVLDAAWTATRKQMETVLHALTPAQRSAVMEAMSILKGIFGSVSLPVEKPTAPRRKTLSSRPKTRRMSPA